MEDEKALRQAENVAEPGQPSQPPNQASPLARPRINSPALPEQIQPQASQLLLLRLLEETPPERRDEVLATWLIVQKTDPEYIRATGAHRLRLVGLLGAALLAAGSLAGLIFYSLTLPATVMMGLLLIAFLAVGIMAAIATGQSVSLKEFGNAVRDIIRSTRNPSE